MCCDQSHLKLNKPGTEGNDSLPTIINYVLGLPFLSFIFLVPVYIFYFTYLTHFKIPIELNLNDAINLFLRFLVSNGAFSAVSIIFIISFIFFCFQLGVVKIDFRKITLLRWLKMKLDRCFRRIAGWGNGFLGKWPRLYGLIRPIILFVSRLIWEFFKIFGVFFLVAVVAIFMEYKFKEEIVEHLATVIFCTMLLVIPMVLVNTSSRYSKIEADKRVTQLILLYSLMIILSSVFIVFLSHIVLSLEVRLSTFDKTRYLVVSGEKYNFMIECYNKERASLVFNQGISWSIEDVKVYRDYDVAFARQYCFHSE